MGALYLSCSEADITPRFPLDLCGYGGRINPSIGVLDRLTATVVRLEEDGKVVFLIGGDLLCFGSGLKNAILKELSKWGIKEEQVFLFATHTHSGPNTGGIFYMGKVFPRWIRFASANIFKAVKETGRKRRGIEIKAGKSQAEIAINRRNWDKGFVDKEVAVISLGGIPFVNFSCHAVCLGSENRFVSADFPGRARIYIKSRWESPIVLMANGACGDLNPRERGIEAIEKTGRTLADAVEDALQGVEATKGGGMRYRHREVTFPLAEPPSPSFLQDFISQQRKAIREAPLSDRLLRQGEIRWAKDALKKLQAGSWEKEAKGKISLLLLGEIALLFLPGEVFSEIGKKAKLMMQERGLFPLIIGYYDELVGYIPTASAFEEGGYEVSDAYRWYGKPAPFLPVVEDIVLQTVDTLLKEM